jgi:sulfide dehydrogenase [flavocytochrome c] flavoprotein chain
MRRRQFLQLGAAAAAGATSALRALSAPGGRRVVIAGGGFAGSSCALRLRSLNPTLQVTLIDPQSRYVTCPMSNAALIGLRSMRSLTVTRHAIVRAGVRYLNQRVAALDAERRTVTLGSGEHIAYDKLVVAPGIRFLFGTPAGYDEAAAQRMPHAWEAGSQTELLTAQLRAMPAGGTVAISVPAGLMRCPPGPYERASLIAYWLKQHKPRSKVLIFDSNNHFPRQELFTAAWQALYPGMIEWVPSTEGGAVTRVDVAASTLHSASGAHRVAVANIIPPQAPAALAAQAGLASGHGWCPVDGASFESQLLPGIYVIGDAAIAGSMPKAASAAFSQGQRCATAIAAALDGREATPPELESICYSLLSPDSALAIHAHFALTDGELQQLAPAADQPAPAASAELAVEATQWYQKICRDSFAA